MNENDLMEQQAYDEYVELTKNWEDILLLRQRLYKQIDGWVAEEKGRYEKKVAPLMDYVNERIVAMAEIQRQKYGEELRELEPLEKEPND
jgi:hypothetical protein